MLDVLGNLGDFVGGLAVVVTLIYLALQIRQNTATTRVQTVQHLLSSDTASTDSQLAGPLPEILAKLDAGERLTPTEASAYTTFMRGRATDAWQVFYQRQNGMIEEEVAGALLARFAYFARTALFGVVWHRNLSATRHCWSKGNGGLRWLHETSFVVQRVRIPPGQG
jgi:hypothetical protein